MDKLQDPFEVWDNGTLTPFYPAMEDIVTWLTDFFMRTGARKRVGTQWTYQGKNTKVKIARFRYLITLD